MGVELHFVPARADGATDRRQAVDAEAPRGKWLDVEGRAMAVEFELAHDERNSQFLVVVGKASPHALVVAERRLNPPAHHALLGAFGVDGEVDLCTLSQPRAPGSAPRRCARPTGRPRSAARVPKPTPPSPAR